MTKNTAKILDRGSCLVRIGPKSVRLAADWAPNATPDFIIYIPANKTWDSPSGAPISKQEIDEIRRFLPGELKDRDGLTVEILDD